MHKRSKYLWLSACAALLLAGCDGSVNFTIDGAVNHATAGEIFRGLAFNSETIDEDPAKSDKRRDLYEFIATRAGVHTDAKFMKVLEANPHYANITIDAKQLAPGDETVDAVWVKFDVDHQINVTLNFLQPEKRVFGPLRLNRLPILDSITMAVNGKTITNFDSKEVLLTHILNSNTDSFANHLTQLTQAMKAQANVEAQCRKGLPNPGDFEADPSLPQAEKERAYQEFYRQQQEALNACVRQRMNPSNR